MSQVGQGEGSKPAREKTQWKEKERLHELATDSRSDRRRQQDFLYPSLKREMRFPSFAPTYPETLSVQVGGLRAWGVPQWYSTWLACTGP
jgi:hypothetical protein